MFSDLFMLLSLLLLYMLMSLLILLLLWFFISARLQAGRRQAFIIAHHGKQSKTRHVAQQSRGVPKVFG